LAYLKFVVRTIFLYFKLFFSYHNNLEVMIMTERPTAISVLAVLYYIGAGLSLLGAIVMLAMGATIGSMLMAEMNMPASGAAGMTAFLAVFLLGFAVLEAAVGWGLWNLKPWARITAIVLGILGLLNFPIGTVIQGIFLYFLFRADTKAAFSA
jgi:hypothetical protein